MTLREGGGSGPGLPDLHRRFKWIALALALGFTMLIGRLWQLQVLRGDSYYERTRTNVVREHFLPAVRGKVFDRNGAPLADNRPAFNVYAIPTHFTPLTRAELARLLGLTDEELLKVDDRIAVGTKRDANREILILEDQGRDRAALLEQNAGPALDGITVNTEPFRFYPHGGLAAHLIGYLTQMNSGEYDQLAAQGYDASELVGRYGLESAWENYLRGKKGIERFAVDARGRRLDDRTAKDLIVGDRLVSPVPGANLRLTIDLPLQEIAERAVAPHLAAAAVVVDIKTGQILAMVSKPAFDPNVMTGHLTRAEEALLAHDPRKPFIDKVLRGTYPPGSVFKFVTTLAALEDGQAAEDEPIVCNQLYELSGNTFKCTAAHGKLDLLGAIQHSCNIYFWTLAERIGLDRMAEVARDYGFGAPTNLGLNGDAGGRMPTKAWYETRGKYKVGYATNAATGQGDVEVTVLQMAMAYAALANGGTLFVPQLVDRVEGADGRVIVQYQPKVARQIRTPLDSLDSWRRGMFMVVNEPGGTGFPYATSQVVTIAGKTGTAEVKPTKKRTAPDEIKVDGWNPRQSHAWFAGWAPAEDPEVAIVVLIEHGGGGGKTAGPVAKQILEGWFTKVRGHESAQGSAITPAAPQGATP